MSELEPPGDLLDWTGHPLVDVGVATLCAMSERPSPKDLTLEDLDGAAKEMEEYYFRGLMQSYLSCVFTMNAEYTQPAKGPKKDQRRRDYVGRVLYAHRYSGDPGATGLRCMLSGRPATHLVERRQMPMLTGEGVLNFFPGGIGGLPLCGPYVTALQALPLGGRRCEGKLLIAQADEPKLTLAIAARFVEDNRRLLALGKAGGLPLSDEPSGALPREMPGWDSAKKQPKYPDVKGAASLVVNDLMELWDKRSRSGGDMPVASLTVYLLSNSGKGPSIDIYHLPCNLLRFLILADRGSARAAWRRLVQTGWEALKGGTAGGPGRSQNRVISDLLRIYEAGFADPRAAVKFVRNHLLGGLKQKPDEASHYWDLTRIFLKEVLGMDERRIEGIKSFADRLAEYIRERNDKDLLRSIMYAERSGEFRVALVKTQRAEALRHNRLLFGLDEYLEIFEAEDNLGRLDWRLVRDLISIRVMEQLQKTGYLSSEDISESRDELASMESQ